MKIRPLLNEDVFQTFDSGAVSPLHVAMLKKLASGTFDPLTGLNPRIEATLDDMMDLGLIDSAYELTPAGQRTITVASKVETPALKDARRKAAFRRDIARKERPEPVEVEVELDDDGFEPDDDVSGDDDLGGTLRTEKKKRKSNVKALSRDDFSSFDKEDDDYLDDDGEYKWD